MSGLFRILVLSVVLISGLGCSAPVSQNQTVLMIGDSMFAWNRTRGSGVGKHLSDALQTPVADRSISGAHVNVSGPEASNPKRAIVAQYQPGSWDWVVINGGANDLLFECGCGRCAENLNGMISPDASSGALVDLVARARGDGAKVMLVGYHAGRDGGHYFSGCRAEVSELVRRQTLLARKNEGVYVVRARTVLDSSNPAHFYFDRVHPSKLGSELIAGLVAREIKRIDPRY